MKKNHKRIVFIGILTIILSVFLIVFYFSEEKVYTSKEYNSKNQLIGINEYVMRNNQTVLHGKFERYNNKGILISKGQFLNGQVFGKCYYYFDNGNIQELHFRKNKDITLESTFYNQKGFVEKYIVYDYLGNYFLKIYFDEKGVTNYSGRFHIETFQYKFANKAKFNISDEQYLKVGDTLNYSYMVANIPNSKRNFRIENLGLDNTKIKRIIKKIEPCQIDVKEVLTKKGKNTIRSIVQYEFNDTITPILIDTLSFDVIVN